jgi:trans-2-enoyl-CoA reductase
MLSLALAPRAEEVNVVREREATLASSTLSGYIDTSAIWMFGKGTILYGRSFDGGSNSQENKQDGFNLNVIYNF